MFLTIKKLWAKLTNRVYVCIVSHDGDVLYRFARKHKDGYLWCVRFPFISADYMELYPDGTAKHPHYKSIHPIKWFPL